MFKQSFVVLIVTLGIESAALPEDTLPIVPEGFVVDVVAKESMVSNPCVMAFDKLGRICVAQGPQWRGPTPKTPGDRIDILIDDDNDGIADRRKTFAEGFNSIQGIAWHGDDLWVANAPDLTVVRDTDGDDIADEYLRVYTGLGNLEHSLHGLNIGPDGKLYMSKGNSKGYNRLDQLAPRVFRDLWGLPSPEGAPDYTPIEKFTKETYQRNYHTPNDDWGQSGGILRCDPINKKGEYGRNLEIVSRGFRNPWDISFDDGFNWLGTDNDQTAGDKIFAPFFGAHFGWGHPWSFHWTGEGHLPTVPASAPLFEGSGAGVIHYHSTHFPEEYRNVFLVNDWMRREIYLFKPKWDGAHLKSEGGFPGTFIHAGGGRSLPASSGRVFEPTDIEVGPDGAIYVLSWGHAYGATIKDGKQVDAGRVYRIRHQPSPLTKWEDEHRKLPHAQWTHEQLFSDLGSCVPVWSVNAQQEFVKRGERSLNYLTAQLESSKLTRAQETWTLWTVGRFEEINGIDDRLAGIAIDRKASLNARIQAVRILGFRVREFESIQELPNTIQAVLKSKNPRLRHAGVLAVEQANQKDWTSAIVDLIKQEQDRVVFYSAWKTLQRIVPAAERKKLLNNQHERVILATLLSLFDKQAIDAKDVETLRTTPNLEVAVLVNDWLVKTGNAEPIVQFDPPPGEYTGPVSVTMKPSKGGFLTYTLDGSRPTYTSPRVSGPITISRNTKLRVALNVGNGGILYASADYKVRYVPPYRHREIAANPKTPSGLHYEMDWNGLANGKPLYTDRTYFFTRIPTELRGLPFLRMANNDDRSSGDSWLSFDLSEGTDLLVGVDVRNNAPLKWMKIGQPDGFTDTGLEIVTTDPTLHIYRKHFPKGKVVLGGNTNNPKGDSGRGNYIVIFDRQLIKSELSSTSITTNDVLAKMKTADSERGRELFLHPRGAGCVKCHLMEGRGAKLAPDLSDIGTRAKKAEILIDSILKPSAVITEGFAQQQIVSSDGKVFSGAVLEETGQEIKLVDSKGEVTRIPRASIEERVGTKISPMPDGFGRMLNAQQTADVVAWLMTQKTIGDRGGFWFKHQTDNIEIHFGSQRIATYLKRHPKLTRRALVNVNTPSGIQVTRNFPPRKPEDIDPGYGAEQGIIHPVMHPGIWVGYGDVDGNDYWRLQSEVEFDGFVEKPRGDKKQGAFSVRNQLKSKDGGRTVCIETTHYQFERVPEGLLMFITAEYLSKERDFYFGDQEESGLAIRVASPIRVQGGNGTILNNRGEKNGGQVWGQQAEWFDYFGTVGKRVVGIMVVPNPQNPRPSWLHARDYGVVVTNPFPKQPSERREPYVKTWVKKGQPFRLSYAVFIHESPTDQPLDRTKAFNKIRSQFEK